MNVAPHPINCLSICAGGGGLDFAVELAIPDARTVCLVEREAFAVSLLVEAMQAGLLAPAPVWSDASTFRGRPWRGTLDIIFGGIPCQPWSVAGKQAGSADERDLWSVARRLFVQSGAWCIIIENVPGMLSGGGADRVRRDLQRLGCTVEGGLFRASEVGATHERERLFIVGIHEGRWMANSNRQHDDGAGGRSSRSGDGKDELLLNSQARIASSLPDPETPTHGEPSSNGRRTLNPRFVEWLMGWPPGWTSYECSGMALSHWRERMQSALSSMPSPPKAALPQLDLFGEAA